MDQFEASERARGELTEGEIKAKASHMLGSFMKQKWKEGEMDPPALLASGRVKRLPGSGEVSVSEWQRWGKILEEGGDPLM